MRAERSLVMKAVLKIKLKGNLMKALKLLDTHNILTEQKKLNGKTEW